ncbi:hypothetical protein THTE_0608 [Thermogutta terrifontis]|uniref:Uncharacterized protein n=1 Tax=Thermogutta terrifontis TaxID=1331910 RepID=A0A286RB71_9BACT|nr:hypothetical protein THTE_0608 [Thermogutta terrifontis]
MVIWNVKNARVFLAFLRLSVIHQRQSQFELTDVVPGFAATLRIGAKQAPLT